jgi:hypothetical protein
MLGNDENKNNDDEYKSNIEIYTIIKILLNTENFFELPSTKQAYETSLLLNKIIFSFFFKFILKSYTTHYQLMI